jgi:hypothetical protein
MPPWQRRLEDKLDAFFDRVLDALPAEGVSPEFAGKFANLKGSLINPDVSTMAATEFSLEEAVAAFGLESSERLVRFRIPGEPRKWRIEDIPEMKDFVLTPCLSKSFKHSRSTVDPSPMVWLE